MTSEHDDLESLREDLLCDRALHGLGDEDRDRLALLVAGPDESLERTAAAVAVVLEHAAGLAPLPDHLAARVLRDARPFVEPRGEPVAPAAPAYRPETRRLRLAAWSGWAAAAAASIALAFTLARPPDRPAPPARPEGSNPPPSLAERVDRLLAGLPHVALKSSGHPLAGQAGGELFWDLAKQEGYMKIKGLAPVEPGKGVYQLWIFDARRDERYPVDGGVFTVKKSDAPSLIPFRAPLPVEKPTLFAITLEPPGGVVVSDRQRIMLAAQWAP